MREEEKKNAEKLNEEETPSKLDIEMEKMMSKENWELDDSSEDEKEFDPSTIAVMDEDEIEDLPETSLVRSGGQYTTTVPKKIVRSLNLRKKDSFEWVADDTGIRIKVTKNGGFRLPMEEE